MKKIEFYSKDFESKKIESSNGIIYRYLKEDNIEKILQDNCVYLGIVKDEHKFVYNDMTNSTLYITICYRGTIEPEKNYKRILKIETMPASINIAEGLSRLLEENGFKKIK